jgi:hypothetical protein
MNILQQEDLIKGTPDDLLVQEAQNPSGAVPQFLVISEIQRRKDMRQRFEAEEEQPQQTVAEQIVSEAVPPQGIAALSPQMPPQAPAGAMPPQMPPEMMPPPQMPPEMMAAQMAPAAPQPQQAMMAGGGLIPGSIMEDASKFSPESLYDVGPMQQSAMANATNMGIPSVLPMAGGGVVRMQNEGQVPENGEQVPERGLVESATDTSEAVKEWIINKYTNEDGSVDKSKVATELAMLGMLGIGPVGWAARGGWTLLKGAPAAYRGIRGLIESRRVVPPSVRANLGQRIAAQLGQKGPGRGRKGGQEWYDRLVKEHPWRAGGLAAESAGKGAGRALTGPFKRHPMLTRGGGIYGLAAHEYDLPPFGGSEQAPGPTLEAAEAMSIQERLLAAEAAGETIPAQFRERYLDSSNGALHGGGVVKMRSGATVPDDDAEVRAWLNSVEFDPIPTRQFSPLVLDPRLGVNPGPQAREQDRLNRLFGMSQDQINNLFSDRSVDAAPDTTVDGVQPGSINPPGSVSSFNENLLDMLTERTTEIKELLDTKTPLPDYEALRTSITEGVDDDVAASILTSIGKSIYEGKGLAGADVSQAQAIRQKARDATSALELAKAQGASAKEVADLDRRVNAYTALLSAIPSPMRSFNPLTGMTTLERLQRYRDTLPEGDPDREAVENRIAGMTDPGVQEILAELLLKQGGVESYDPVTNTIKTVIGMEALTPGEQKMWNNAKQIGALDQLINQTLSESLETS